MSTFILFLYPLIIKDESQENVANENSPALSTGLMADLGVKIKILLQYSTSPFSSYLTDLTNVNCRKLCFLSHIKTFLHLEAETIMHPLTE